MNYFPLILSPGFSAPCWKRHFGRRPNRLWPSVVIEIGGTNSRPHAGSCISSLCDITKGWCLALCVEAQSFWEVERAEDAVDLGRLFEVHAATDTLLETNRITVTMICLIWDLSKHLHVCMCDKEPVYCVYYQHTPSLGFYLCTSFSSYWWWGSFLVHDFPYYLLS